MKTHETKSKSLSIRLKPSQYSIISQMANDANLSVGDFLVHSAIGNKPQPQKSLSKIASLLCQHSILVAGLPDEDTRNCFVNWEKQVWRHLK